jgi:hypothetical protein
MPTVLFVHNGSPGRFAFLATALLRRGWRGALINGPEGRELPGVTTVRWQSARDATPGVFAAAARSEVDLIRGRAAAQVAVKLNAEGFEPDLIIGHPGWGEMAFLREVFPAARQIQVGEYYSRVRGGDTGFDYEFESKSFDAIGACGNNAVLAMSL